jgi:RND superfamily putative drug exporter
LIALLLLIVFRGVGAPLVTLGAAGLSYVISIRVLTWLADQMGTAVPQEIQPVLVALLLGLTTDYAVFFLSGARRRLVEGAPRVEAAQQAARYVLPITVTAGLVVAVGSGSLVIGNLSFFRAFGPGMAVTVLVTLAVTVTLVPAALGIFGGALFWPGLRDATPREPSRLRRLLGKVATTRPVAALLVVGSAAVLIFSASEARSTALGLTLFRGLPATNEVRQAAAEAGQGFARGIVAPTEILLRGPGLGRERDGLESLQTLLEREPGVAGVVGIRDQPRQVHRPVFVNERGDAARFAVIFDDDPLSTHAIHALRHLEEHLPGTLQQAGLADIY